MAVTLLKVGEHLSLELAPEDLDRVNGFIRSRWLDARSRTAGLYRVISFGGAEFTFQDDWVDPCFVSGTDRGDDLLRQIHAALGGDAAA